MLAVCIKRMTFPEKKDEEVCDESNLQAIEENDAQVNLAFKLPYLEKGYLGTEGYHTRLYYVATILC